MKGKILIGILLIFLVIGTASAVNVEDLKSPMGYTEIKGTGAELMTDSNTELYIGEMSLNEGCFENDTGYLVYPLEGNLFAFEDSGVDMYGLQEKVNIDGTDYLVCVFKDVPLSEADKTLFKDDLESFNNRNNVEPIEVEI